MSPPQGPRIQHCRFSTTSTLYKKASKQRSNDEAPAKSPGSKTTKADDDPFDHSHLKASISAAISRLTNELSKLRTGGRFNPESLEGLRVQLQKGVKESTVRLGDLAQVVPRGGRTVVVLVGEKDHIKAVNSAVLSSSLSLTPQPDPQNPLGLLVPIPPPTKESRQQALAQAIKAGESAQTSLKNARQVLQKRLRKMELDRSIRPDDLRRAVKEMEKEVERASTEFKKIVEGTRKALEGA